MNQEPTLEQLGIDEQHIVERMAPEDFTKLCARALAYSMRRIAVSLTTEAGSAGTPLFAPLVAALTGQHGYATRLVATHAGSGFTLDLALDTPDGSTRIAELHGDDPALAPPVDEDGPQGLPPQFSGEVH